MWRKACVQTLLIPSNVFIAGYWRDKHALQREKDATDATSTT
jgi:hypothetical protein